MEQAIAKFMMTMSKFEFFLINLDIDLAHVAKVRGLDVVQGVNWTRLAARVEGRYAFATFDFERSGFAVFRNTAPQYLTRDGAGKLKWDSDDNPQASWDWLLSRSFAQFRNNVAHGNKHQLPAPFTFGRTQEFLHAAPILIEFIAHDVLDTPQWQTPIFN